uniref:Uncharacterized protein n=1 Tax=Tanacetum cinerariifolium TaxID=118510 RepID=A0A699IHR7_TANCI|nr:hypothetical protein [Tanacetum cinerariifolium]
MDPNLSLGKICLGDDVIVISSNKVEGSGDWNSLEYQDTSGSKGKKVLNALSFYKMKTNEVKEDDVEHGVILRRSFMRLAKGIVDFGNRVITIYPEPNPFDDDSEKTEKSLDDWDQLLDFNFDDIPEFGEELPPLENAAKEALTIRINQKFALLEEVRPVIETMAYHEKYKKILDEIWKDKVELDGRIVKEEEEAGKVNENTLADTESDINTMLYQIYKTLGVEDMEKVDRGIMMINHTSVKAMGILTNVLCQVGVTTIIAKFIILDIPIDRDAPIVVGRGFLYTIGCILNTLEKLFSTFDGIFHQTFRATRFNVLGTIKSDSDDEEEYQIKRNKFGASIYGSKPAQYLNCNNPVDRSLALQAVTNTFWKISVWKKAISFLGSLPIPLKQVNWKPDYKGCYTKEEEAIGQWRTKIRLTDPYENIYLQGFTTKKTDWKLSKYHNLSDIMSTNWSME